MRGLVDCADVALMLGDLAPLLHFHAMADLLLCPSIADTLAVEVIYWTTGSCIATVAPHDWLRATPLVRRVLTDSRSR